MQALENRRNNNAVGERTRICQRCCIFGYEFFFIVCSIRVLQVLVDISNN